MQQEYYSNGKLLLTGEYAILDGAKGLAVPTKFGQFLRITANNEFNISWTSIAVDKKTWFTAKLHPLTLEIQNTSDQEIAITLQEILLEAKKMNPDFLAKKQGLRITTTLTFSRKWGLGTSSTLINNIAQWACVDAHQLLWNSFGGSGYDISCAQHNTPILYHIKNNLPQVELINFNPSFKDAIFFVYLNQKQSSKKAITTYRTKNFSHQGLILELDEITLKMVFAKELPEFEALIKLHEQVLSKILETAPIKEKLFPEYFGAVKSLGGWGGDFVMATGNKKTPEYFKSQGFSIVVPFTEMVL